ncbi:RNA-directed DNA polymerase from mobile element jockey [Elysia marginata]|uniref:RNA-directed DNA polymerase from mobile element jockey n=1 Tax=Elysia marginata TaxID=1093978 RepID=A0AAV4GQD9_9GAST|nr:RNA-directed DNA polymerase from mobile element jockey [Elysia marginata]
MFSLAMKRNVNPLLDQIILTPTRSSYYVHLDTNFHILINNANSKTLHHIFQQYWTSPCTIRDFGRFHIELMPCIEAHGCTHLFEQSLILGAACCNSKCQETLKAMSEDCVSCITATAPSLADAVQHCVLNVFRPHNRFNGPGLLLMSKHEIVRAEYHDYFPGKKMAVQRGYIEAESRAKGTYPYRKSTPKPDDINLLGAERWDVNAQLKMMFRNMDYSRLGASSVDPQADEVPGSLPRKSPPQATGRNINERNKSLTILHWNAKGISRKKLALANRLKKEDIDVACIQESHLTPHPKHGRRFTMKGYQTFKQDRQDGPKVGVITLVKNDVTASEIKANAGDRAEMIRTELHFKDKNITIYNCFCPPGEEHALHAMNISDECIVVGDFSCHSPSWGYENQDARGEEVEDWQTNMSLLLLNSPEDPRTFYSRSWMTTSTPDLAFATEDIAV